MQSADRNYRIPLPRLEGSILCPVDAFRKLTEAYPAGSRDPLLCITKNSKRRYFTSRMLRDLFKVMVTAVGYDTSLYSLHGLRRGGATLAFNSGVAAPAIRYQGTWKSDVFWEYIARDVKQSPVAAGFKSLLSQK